MNCTEQLTQIFRDNFVAYYRAHVAHVNVVGRNFASDHKLLQKTYEDLQNQIDQIGELLRTLQEFMPDDITDVIEMSHIDTGQLSGSSDFLIEKVMEDLEHLCEMHRELVIICEDTQPQISNYAQDRILALDKHIWMHRATLD
jgi:DNA-binding ferritin-like protein